MPEVQVLEGKVQDKDKEPEIFSSVEELEKAFEKNSELREEFIHDEKGFIEKHTKGKPKEDSPKKESVEKDEIVETKKVDINAFEVDEDLLGTYAKDRTPENAVMEALKGNAEKDRTINRNKVKVQELQDDLDVAKNETSVLRQQIEESKKKPAKVEKVEIANIEIPELPDDVDMFTEEGQKVYKDHLKAVRKSNESLKEQVKSIASSVNNFDEEMTSVKNDVIVEKENVARTKALRTEYTQIDELGITSRPAKEIEADYVDFMETLHKIVGSKNPLYNQNGGFSKEVSDALVLYSEPEKQQSDKGNELRVHLARLGRTLPNDFDGLTKIYQIRDLRNKYRDSTGNFMSYEVAQKLYEVDTVGDKIIKAKSDINAKKQKALNNRKEYAKETPTKGGPSKVDPQDYPKQQIENILSKASSTRTPEETEFATTWMKAMGFPESEIETLTKKGNNDAFI